LAFFGYFLIEFFATLYLYTPLSPTGAQLGPKVDPNWSWAILKSPKIILKIEKMSFPNPNGAQLGVAYGDQNFPPRK
jgi:hypothetical protein